MIENEIEENKKRIYLISGIVITLLIVLGAWWYYTRPSDVKDKKSPQAEIRSNTSSKALSKEFKASPPMSTSKDKEKAQEPSFSSARVWTQEPLLWGVGGTLTLTAVAYYLLGYIPVPVPVVDLIAVR